MGPLTVQSERKSAGSLVAGNVGLVVSRVIDQSHRNSTHLAPQLAGLLGAIAPESFVDSESERNSVRSGARQHQAESDRRAVLDCLSSSLEACGLRVVLTVSKVPRRRKPWKRCSQRGDERHRPQTRSSRRERMQ